MARICTRCGAELQENDIYCGKCGQLTEGMAPPPNAWSAVGPVLSAMPQKKKGKGCLVAFLIFLAILAAVVAAAYFYLRGSLSPSKPKETKTPTATESSSGGGISITWDDLLKPAQSKEPTPTPAATSEPVETAATVETPAQTVENPFNDVDEGKYYYDAALWAYQNGLTSGTSFYPADPCTRAQFITMLWRASGSPETAAVTQLYSDVETKDYYYQACMWANNMGITTATPGSTFNADDPITRAQAATFLYRLMGYDPSISNPFTDVKESDYFYKPALWALDAGIVGSSDVFNPKGICDRGNAVTFIYRTLKDRV